MDALAEREGTLRVDVRNVGGIDRTTVELDAGVNVLSGENATNRTSFLRAVMGGLGSDDVFLKGDADEGRVAIELGDWTFERTFRRTDDGVVTGGDPYLEDPTLADLYAFLLESNEARRAVERGDDLRALIMRPVDTDAIRRQFEELTDERRRVEGELAELSGLEDRHSTLREREEALRAEIEDGRQTLAEAEGALESMERDVEAQREQRAELEAAIEALNDARNRLDRVGFEIDSQEESLTSARREKREVESELEDVDVGEPDDLRDRIDDLREEKRSLDAATNRLQTLVQFNQSVLEGDGRLADLLEDVDRPVTEALAPDDGTRTCWTCGSEAPLSRFEESVERLRELSLELRADRSGIAEELDDLTERRRRIDARRERQETLQARAERLADEMSDREEAIESLEAERDALAGTVEDLEAEVESLATEEDSDLLEAHEAANELAVELERLESEHADVEEEIREIEARLAERSDLEARREEIGERGAELRTRIDRIEREAVDQFNEHMAELLDLLGYDNVERIWIERRATEGDDTGSSRAVEFRLHVIRTNDSGAGYEDTIDHLSESEREVTGLVFALAGYLVHDVAETLPVILLDSLEAIDADRIARLVEYFEAYADYLIVALLPNDAAALDDDHRYVTDI